MPSFELPADSSYQHDEGGKKIDAVKKGAFDKFNPEALGLGDIRKESVAKAAIAALFDLQGFTIFCKQIEPHLSVPIYLSGFLDWMFGAIRNETVQKDHGSGVVLWHDLPFFIKFMGDGLLVLWDTAGMRQTAQHNLIVSCLNIIQGYRAQFVPSMRRRVSDVPPVLRCGIAKGTVFSVGNGEDYVGSCINMAARLQKLASLPIAFARRGFDPEETWKGQKQLANWILKKVSVRGIGDNELVYVRKEDFKALAPEDRELLSDP